MRKRHKKNWGCMAVIAICLMAWLLLISGVFAIRARAAAEGASAQTDEAAGQETTIPELVEVVCEDLMTEDPIQPAAAETESLSRYMAGVNEEQLLNLPTPEPEPQLVSMGVFKITAYCACERCCGKDPSDPWYGITATGTRATEGRTIAVDPRVIPYGTVVYIDGKEYIAEDCGGGIKEKEIDMYIADHQRAREWGNQYWEVFAYVTD